MLPRWQAEDRRQRPENRCVDWEAELLSKCRETLEVNHASTFIRSTRLHNYWQIALATAPTSKFLCATSPWPKRTGTKLHLGPIRTTGDLGKWTAAVRQYSATDSFLCVSIVSRYSCICHPTRLPTTMFARKTRLNENNISKSIHALFIVFYYYFIIVVQLCVSCVLCFIICITAIV